MWLDLKKCTFVIFVITMFSLLAVQPAFSLESDFVSTGNSTVGVFKPSSYADLLTNINDDPIKDNKSGVEYRFDEVAGDKNKVILHQSKDKKDILDNYGDFNITFKVPKGHRFTFYIDGNSGLWEHSKINVSDGNSLLPIEISVGGESLFLKKNEYGKIDHTTNGKPPVNIEEWFYTESDDYTINISGHRGIQLEFYVIFNDSTA